MQLYFEHPTFLWLLAGAVPVLLWAAWRSYAIAPRWRRVTSLALRTIAVACVALALSRPILRTSVPDQSIVFALDISDSVESGALANALAHVEAATQNLASHQRAALIVFGGRAEVLRKPEQAQIRLAEELIHQVQHRARKDKLKAEILELERDLSGDAAQRLAAAKANLQAVEQFATALETQESDLRCGFRLARSVMPESARKRIVLFSDGNWTRNDPAAELQFVARAGITVDVVPFERTSVNEVIAERLIAPSQVRVREPVELELQVSAAQAGSATLKLFRDQFLLKSETIQLQKGRNAVRIPKQELDEGFHEFMATVGVEQDPTPENNTARAVVVVDGRPRVLLIEGREEDGRHLEQALRDEDIAVELRPAIGFPQELNELLGYDVLILSDVPATDLATSQLSLVKSFVRDYGGGLIMLGGEKSFGLGGYYRTPVEDALPVRMPIKKTIEKPNLALVLVLDRSGSMSGEKLSLAKEAAIASVEVLKPKDQIGVVAFDDAADWVVELQAATNRDEIASQVARIAVGGGTFIYSGLYEAYQCLRDSSAKLKHCIVLTDGHTTGSREDHLDLTNRMAAEEMTVSTVGIGDADRSLLEAMAEAGGGEAYFTNDFGSIPQIFSKETLRASKSMLVEEPFVPVPVRGDDEILKGVELADAPLLMGYVATTPKETARLLLVSDHGDPVLARWNYGLGRSAAFTSDAKNRWAADWIGWPQFGKFWSQVVRSVMSVGTTSALQQTADIRVEKGSVSISLDNRDRDGRFIDEVKPTIALVDGIGNAKALAVEHVAPGLFESSFPLTSYGEFTRLRVESHLDQQLVGLKKYAVVESYPPEYRAAASDLSLLRGMADVTGGRLQPTPEQAAQFSGDAARGLMDLWRVLVLIAALLLPLDIALRRMG